MLVAILKFGAQMLIGEMISQGATHAYNRYTSTTTVKPNNSSISGFKYLTRSLLVFLGIKEAGTEVSLAEVAIVFGTLMVVIYVVYLLFRRVFGKKKYKRKK